MTVRTGYRLLLDSEQDQDKPHFLIMDARGEGTDPSIYITLAGAGLAPYEDDPMIELSAKEGRELIACLEQLLENDEGAPERNRA
jgi:hypothetical protein